MQKDSQTTTDTEHPQAPDAASALLRWFLLYLFALLYYECALRLMISGELRGTYLTFLTLLPAEALFLAGLSGFHRRTPLMNRIVSLLLLALLTTYYFAQLIYYRIFTSLFSIHMVGMGGDAVTNFGWAMRETLFHSLDCLAILLLPLLLTALGSFLRTKRHPAPLLGWGYAPLVHLVCFAGVVALWLLGIAGLKALGTDRGSAYHALKDPTSDTDTTAARLGALSTALLEGASYYLGLGSTPAEIGTVDTEALSLGSGAPVSPAPAETEEQIVETETADAAEEIALPQPHINPAIDFDALSAQAETDELAALCSYFASKPATETNAYTGLFSGYNLIYICAEAFSNYGLDPDVTPLLYEMSQNGIVLHNYYNSYLNTTVNGEFSFLTALWPDVSRTASRGTAVGSLPQSANKYMPYGLGSLLSAEGASVHAYHNYYGSYYRRCYSFPNLGYTDVKFMNEGMRFSTVWPASDLEMLEQSVDDYINEERFHAYYMTFSGHGPYADYNSMYQRNSAAVRELLGGRYTNVASVAYLSGERELELGMEYLVERLREAGRLDDTLIVLVGDHYPYLLPDSARVELNGGAPLDTDFEQYHSTCILYNAALTEPIESDVYCCNVDILPTVLNLLDISYDSRLFAGSDIFSGGVHRARLYNGSFLTELVRYNAPTGTAVWTDAADAYEDAELDRYLSAMLDYTESEYTASLQMMQENFYYYVWKNAGLLSPEEAEAELAREAAGESRYDAEAAAEAAEAAAEAAAAATEEAAQEAGETEGTEPELPVTENEAAEPIQPEP